MSGLFAICGALALAAAGVAAAAVTTTAWGARHEASKFVEEREREREGGGEGKEEAAAGVEAGDGERRKGNASRANGQRLRQLAKGPRRDQGPGPGESV